MNFMVLRWLVECLQSEVYGTMEWNEVLKYWSLSCTLLWSYLCPFLHCDSKKCSTAGTKLGDTKFTRCASETPRFKIISVPSAQF